MTLTTLLFELVGNGSPLGKLMSKKEQEPRKLGEGEKEVIINEEESENQKGDEYDDDFDVHEEEMFMMQTKPLSELDEDTILENQGLNPHMM